MASMAKAYDGEIENSVSAMQCDELSCIQYEKWQGVWRNSMKCESNSGGNIDNEIIIVAWRRVISNISSGIIMCSVTKNAW